MTNCYQTNKGSKHHYALQLFIFLQLLFVSGNLIAQPIITSFAPKSGAVGSTVTLTGSNFSTSLNGNVVFFGGVKATVSAASSSSLTVLVPKGATSRLITVTSNKLTAYAAEPFRVTFQGSDTAFTPASLAPKLDFGINMAGYSGWDPVYLTDLDGDGKLDVFSPNNTYNYAATTLRNLSAPGIIYFGELTDFHANGFPKAGAVGDFDGDGKPDLAISTEFQFKICVYKNTSVPGAINFAPRMDFLLDAIAPFDLACTDIDGDGKPDLVTTIGGTNIISVLKNNTANDIINFSTRQDFTVGESVQSIVIGDVDRDGKPDLVTTNAGSNTISLLRNTTSNGVISFAPKVDLPTGNTPRFTAIGDLDNDGELDLVTTNSVTNTITIYKNNSTPGTISFIDRKDFTTALAPYGVNLEDLDGDGDLDIAEANVNSNSISIFKNISTPGSIQLSQRSDYATFTNPYFVALGDLDGDGKSDVAVGCREQGSISMLRNKTNEPVINSVSPSIGYNGTILAVAGVNLSATTRVTIGGTPVSSFTVTSPTTVKVVVGNGSSGNIVLTTPYGTATISGFVYMPPPQFNFSPQLASKGATILISGNYLGGTKSVSFGGVPALSFKVLSTTSVSAVVSDGATGSVTVENETGVTSLPGFTYVSPPTIDAISPASAAPGTQVTITGNNFNSIAGTRVVYFGGVKATIAAASNTLLTVTVPYGCTNMPVSVTANFLTGYSYKPFTPIYPGAGSNLVYHSFAPKSDFAAGNTPNGFAVSDFDGDGNLDLASSNNSAYLSVYKNLGTKGSAAFSTKQDYFAGSSTAGVYAGDLDGDGKQDLVTTSPLSQTISTYRNISSVGSIAFSNAQYVSDYITFNRGSDVSITDIDGDGKPDLVVVNSTPNTLSVYRNTSLPGQITFETKLDFPLLSGNKNFAITDLNLDGKPEIVVATNTGVVTIYKNSSTPGTITLTQNSPPTLNNQGISICAGDFDGDGKPDLAVINYSASQLPASIVSVFKNTSAGGEISFASAKDISVGGALGDIVATDVDGDSKPDLAIVNSSANAISILKNNGTGTISFAARYDYPTGTNPQGLVFGDFDKDGKPDMAVFSQNLATVSILKNKVGEPIVTPAGANPVTGIIINRVTIDPSVQAYNGVPYVQRHYDIEPQTNPSLATATVTLFFSQQDFDNFNAFPLNGANLPSSPGDDQGKAALRIYQYHGFSSTGLPGDYQGNATEINPDDTAIIWNANPQWWEVSFNVTGFSGFFIGNERNSVLPLKLLSFIVKKESDKNLLQWVTSDETNMKYFEIQRSSNGIFYDSIGVVNVLNRNTSLQNYVYSDLSGTGGVYYYRLKMVDITNHGVYSNVVFVGSAGTTASLKVYPNPIESEAIVEHPLTHTEARLQIIDLKGAVIKTFKINPNTISTRIATRGMSPGVYHIIWSDQGKMLNYRIIVE